MINTHYLWYKICILIWGCVIDRDQEQRDIVELWLSCSHGLPLSMLVLVNAETHGTMYMMVMTVLTALIKIPEYYESI